MMQALDHGPEHLPQNLFAGLAADWLRGMKVHSNTISHARLIALEETFPKTREAVGHAQFNQLSRTYVETPGVAGLRVDWIGRSFAGFLQSQAIEQNLTDLADVEWAWLESYRAEEGTSLALTDFHGLDEDGVLNLEIVVHPSVRMVQFAVPPHPLLLAEVPDLADAPGVLIVRPGGQVLLSPLSFALQDVIQLASVPIRIGGLYAGLGEQQRESDCLTALMGLIGAGAMMRMPKVWS